jgi:hypothetical protein
MTPEQITACRDHFDPEKFRSAEEWITFLKVVEKTKWDIVKAQEEEATRHKTVLKIIDDLDKANMAQCPHPRGAVVHRPDPWKSYYGCELCGKEGVRGS